MTNAELIAKIKAEIERIASRAMNEEGQDLCVYLLSFISTLESGKPVNQGLDKEIDEISIHVPCSEFTHESEYIDLLDWLKEQFTYFYELGCTRTAEKYDELEYNRQRAEESPLPEDTVLFNKGVEEGKRLMMEDAVVYVAEPETPIGNILIPFIRIEHSVLFRYGIKVGDKVRVIIIKKEDEK